MTPWNLPFPRHGLPLAPQIPLGEEKEKKKKKKRTPIAKEIPKAAATAVAPANKQTSLLSPISLPGTRYL